MNTTNPDVPEKLKNIQTRQQIEALHLTDVLPSSHIIIGPGGKCLCGMYDGQPLFCQQILAWMGPQPIVREETPEEFAVRTVGHLLREARANDPQHFKAFFCGAIIANVVGNLPAEYWEKFIVRVPCDRPGCDCHLMSDPVIEALKTVRAEHQKHTQRTRVE